MANEYDPRDRESYNRFVERSTTGSRSSSTPAETITISKDKYKAIFDKFNKKIERALVIGMVVGVAATSTVSIAAPAISDKMHEREVVRVELSEPADEFKKEIVAPNTFRVNDNKDYAYDYEKISDALYDFGDGDFDKNVYLCYEELGAEQTSYVLDEVEKYKFSAKDENGISQSRSLRNYLYQNNFYPEGTELTDDKAYDEALDNFKEVWENRVIIQNSIDEVENRLNNDKSELNQMLEEHNFDSEKTHTKGGL